MGLFQSILSKLGLGKKEQTAASAPATPAAPAAPAAAKATTPTPLEQQYVPKPATTSAAAKPQMKDEEAAPAPKPEPMAMVDVVAKLEEMARKAPPGLDWKVSIVDLLKLLGIDSSYEARKELATELGCPAEFMGDSAKMNTWLHKTVLQKIAENGGNIPAELLD